MQRAVGNIGSVELCNMYFHSLKFLKAVNNIPGRLQIGKAFLRLPQLCIAVMAVLLRQLGGIMMAGYEIHRDAFLPAEFHKHAYPLFILHAADSGTAHAEPGIHFLYCRKGTGEQLKIFLHVRILPEARQVRLIPDLDGPGYHLFLPVTLHQMAEGCLHQFAPCVIACRRRHISLPVKHGLLSRSHLVRHEAKLQKRPDIQLQVAVHHKIQISKIIFRMLLPVFVRVLLIYGHIVGKQAVAADMGKSDLLLHQGQLLLVLLLQRQPHAACADAVIYFVVKRDLRILFNPETFCTVHFFVSPYICFLYFL